MRTRIAFAVMLAVLGAPAAAQDPALPPPKPAEPKIERRLPSAGDRVAVSPDGKWIAASDYGGALTLFSTQTDEKRSVVPEGPARTADGPGPTTFEQLVFTTDARLLLVYASLEETKDPASLTGKNLDSRTKEWTRIEGYATADGKASWHHDFSQHVYPWAVCVGADIVAVIDEEKLVFLNATTGQTRETAPASAKYECVAAARDGLTFWAGTYDGTFVKVKTFAAPKTK